MWVDNLLGPKELIRLQISLLFIISYQLFITSLSFPVCSEMHTVIVIYMHVHSWKTGIRTKFALTSLLMFVNVSQLISIWFLHNILANYIKRLITQVRLTLLLPSIEGIMKARNNQFL